MRTIAAGFVVLAMLSVPFAFAGTASAAGTQTRDLTPVVIGPVSTDRLGGGDMIAVKAGDAVFGVRYGVAGHVNDIVIFSEFKRFLGVADIVDASGQHLATRGIPVYTILAQSLNRFIEFRNVSEQDGFDLLSADGLLPMTRNVPVKAASLISAWAATTPEVVTGDNVTYVNFTLSKTDLPYTRVFNETNIGDRTVNLVSFTFHLKVEDVMRHAEAPVFQVTVDDGNHREITNVDFLRMDSVTAQAVAMGAKYDHLIQGWDFMLPTDKLALETRLLVGNFIPDRTADIIHIALQRDHADDGTGTFDRDNTSVSLTEHPQLYTRDAVYFDDNYTRIGRFTWASNVTVDGQPSKMLFQVQGGGRLLEALEGAYFFGFWIRGAYVYPAGQTIDHDPAIYAESFIDLPSGFNLTPVSILAIQLGIVGLALVPALYLRSKARRQK